MTDNKESLLKKERKLKEKLHPHDTDSYEDDGAEIADKWEYQEK